MTRSAPRLRFADYAEAEAIPNIVVDGAPNRSTVLTLTHWPGYPAPPGLEADLSAEMAYLYLYLYLDRGLLQSLDDRPSEHALAQVVTNNHFDQDGLVSVHALVERPTSPDLRELLIDVAAAGDFGTYRHRAAARASMALWTWADSERSPIADELAELDYPDQCRLLYQRTLPMLVPLVTDPDQFRELWAEEDDQLTASERAIAAGAITIEERPGIDLAVVSIDDQSDLGGGHRFCHKSLDEVHPMAVNNATGCFRQLLIRGQHIRYLDRYETWVQYRTRRPLPRVDLRPLAQHLSGREPGGVVWAADPPSSLDPTLAPVDGTVTDIDPSVVVSEIAAYLATAEPAWDPYQPRS